MSFDIFDLGPTANTIAIVIILIIITAIVGIITKEKNFVIILIFLCCFTAYFGFMGYVNEIVKAIAFSILGIVFYAIFHTKSEQSLTEQAFRMTQFIQITFFIFYILENFESLDDIVYEIDFYEIEEELTLNFYYVMIGIAVIYVILIALGLNVIDTGLTDSAHNTLQKYVSFFVMFTVLHLGMSYYIVHFDTVGVIITILIAVIYFLKSMTSIRNEEVE